MVVQRGALKTKDNLRQVVPEGSGESCCVTIIFVLSPLSPLPPIFSVRIKYQGHWHRHPVSFYRWTEICQIFVAKHVSVGFRIFSLHIEDHAGRLWQPKIDPGRVLFVLLSFVNFKIRYSICFQLAAGAKSWAASEGSLLSWVPPHHRQLLHLCAAAVPGRRHTYTDCRAL